MKTLSALVAALGVVSTDFAAAPESLEGYLYYETGIWAGAFPTFNESASVFAADGTFQQIYARFNAADRGGAFDPPFRPPTEGQLTYRTIHALTAALSFVAVGFTHSGLLRFSSATSETGTFFDPSFNPPPNTIPDGIISRTFRLVRRDQISPLGNCSNRSLVRPGGAALTGFVISGTENRIVLIRAVGPGLAPFGITDFLPDPVISGFQRNNDNWSSETEEGIKRTSAALGAFPLPKGSKDAAIITRLRPGAYVVKASAVDPAESGQVLIEVYILP